MAPGGNLAALCLRLYRCRVLFPAQKWLRVLRCIAVIDCTFGRFLKAQCAADLFNSTARDLLVMSSNCRSLAHTWSENSELRGAKGDAERRYFHPYRRRRHAA